MMLSSPWNTFKVFLTQRYILLGLAVRLLISPFFAHSFDMSVFVNIVRAFYQGEALFNYWSYPFYSYAILVGFYFPAYLFTDDVFFFGQPFTLLEKFFIKLPSNISDLFIAYVLFLIMKKLGKDRYALPVALFYWFNPMSLFISSVWGMFDSVATVFALLSVYHFTEGRHLLSAVELGVGFGVKQHPIVLLPLFIFFLWREGKGEILKFLLAFSIPAAFSVLPSITIQYNTTFHLYSFGFFPSNLGFISHSFTADIYQLFDPNMTYRALLYRFSTYFFYMGTRGGTELVLFGILYLLFFWFLWKTEFFNKKLSLEIKPLTLCASAVYLIYFLSFPRIS
nr:glycosyltransferase 87 family protein [Candidatus Freyarchaeota archaeon]